jgi:Phosphotransferase enzyme family
MHRLARMCYRVTTMAPQTDQVDAALAAARRAGQAVERGEVVRVAANVLVRLEPGPIAARLSGATADFRDSALSLGREVELVGALAAAGAPVVAPLGGPYEADGVVVTLWPWVEAVASGDAVAAGRALRACHDALLGVDAGSLGLEPLGMLLEAQRLAVRAPSEVAAAIERALELILDVPARIVHGDSHPGNVLWTAGGPLWGDWEDTHLAPLEWDLACLVASARVRGDDFGWAETALAAHGGAYDAELLEVCVDARVAQGAAYLAFTGRGGPEAVAQRVAWLRRDGARLAGRSHIRGRPRCAGSPRGAPGSARPGH